MLVISCRHKRIPSDCASLGTLTTTLLDETNNLGTMFSQAVVDGKLTEFTNTMVLHRKSHMFRTTVVHINLFHTHACITCMQYTQAMHIPSPTTHTHVHTQTHTHTHVHTRTHTNTNTNTHTHTLEWNSLQSSIVQ